MINAMTDVKPREPKKRRYTSALRSEMAEQTRVTVVRAALAEFLEHGYAGATVERIATRAQVSRPTVFAVGQKAMLLKIARDRAIAGDDDPRGIAQRPDFGAIAAAPDAESSLRAFATISASILRRFADLNEVLRQAAAIDPDVAPLWHTSEQERLSAARGIVSTISAKGPLRSGLDAAQAADVLWLLMAPDQYHRLARGRSWSHRRWERWYADTMVQLLLP
jgi:AcrR family transcriptional regulator